MRAYVILSLVLAACAGASASAQEPPRPLLVAAERINAVTPQAVARQTIRLGSYDAGTKQFVWAFEPTHPSNIPGYKTREEGGPAAPQYYLKVNSYTVAYEVEIANKPANFSLALVYRNANGQTITKPATISGNIATVEVSPPAPSQHSIQINQAGAPSGLRFLPKLADQLGAFVVPYLLVSIIYEPPGESSKASYSVTTTAGSSLTLGVTRSSGFITEAAPTDTLMEVFNLVVGLYAQKVGGKAGDFVKGVLEKIGGIQTNTVQFIVDTAVSTSRTDGFRFSLTEAWSTRPNDGVSYPGNGDVFFILRDVVFLYVVHQGKIYMAPIAYAMDRGLIPSELPPDLAPGYLALDPHFRPDRKGPPAGAAGHVALATKATVTSLTESPGDARRFRRLPNQACEQHATKLLEIASTDYQITSGARAVTETKLERATGIVAMATGSTGTSKTSVTYTSATENYSSTTVSPRIELACDGAGFEIEVYFDNLFGTFYTRRGPPLATYAAMTGQAADDQGRPRPNQLVTLAIGDNRYRVRTDGSGNFQFPFATIPSGTGTLMVGGQSFPISYAGTPKRLTVRGASLTEQAAAATPNAPTAKPERQPTVPVQRPRRP